MFLAMEEDRVISKNLLKTLAQISAIFLLCNCNKSAHFVKVAEEVTEASTGTPTTPAPGNQGPAAPQKTACEVFMEQLQPVDLNATEDRTITQADGDLNLGSLRNISITGYRDEVAIQSAININSISGMSGQGFINAGRVGSIIGQTGRLCLRANQIDLIQNSLNLTLQIQRVLEISNLRAGSKLIVDGHIEKLTGISGGTTLTTRSIGQLSNVTGGTTIRAESIDSIDNVGSSIIIHGARVGTITNNRGVITLVEGATVANPSGNVRIGK